jgi:hypothetical protein
MIEVCFIAVVAVVIVSFPFVVFLSVKLGTYAYFQGRELFEREKENGEK